MGMSWFVEGKKHKIVYFMSYLSQQKLTLFCATMNPLDITLFSTTLRFAASNEIATVSNGSIAAARITNCARSKNATVHTILKFHIKCHQNGLIEKYRKGVDQYVDDHPNVWDSVLFFRCEDIDSNNEIVTYRLAIRSRFTWQIANRVFQSHSDLQ
jgi:hypothetical protein